MCSTMASTGSAMYAISLPFKAACAAGNFEISSRVYQGLLDFKLLGKPYKGTLKPDLGVLLASKMGS